MGGCHLGSVGLEQERMWAVMNIAMAFKVILLSRQIAGNF